MSKYYLLTNIHFILIEGTFQLPQVARSPVRPQKSFEECIEMSKIRRMRKYTEQQICNSIVILYRFILECSSEKKCEELLSTA